MIYKYMLYYLIFCVREVCLVATSGMLHAYVCDVCWCVLVCVNALVVGRTFVHVGPTCIVCVYGGYELCTFVSEDK